MLVRFMSPDGTLGDIPEDQVEAAVAAGGRVMTPDDLKDMFNRIFMTHTLITDQRKKRLAKFAPRQSMRMKMRKKRR